MDLIFDSINQTLQAMNGVTLKAVIFKLVLAIFLSGLIGLERGSRKHTAGFRTHMLVCAGACIAMMTNQYIVEFISPNGDPARLGAQVITGVGFLGAGTIVLAGRQIVGLTTAAGLWASACLGLAIGIGFFSAAIVATILMLIVLAFMPKIESLIYANSKSILLHIELDKATRFMEFIRFVQEKNIKIIKTSVSKNHALVHGGVSFRIIIEKTKDMTSADIFNLLQEFDGVYIIEEL